jgi:hypothetical protein
MISAIFVLWLPEQHIDYEFKSDENAKRISHIYIEIVYRVIRILLKFPNQNMFKSRGKVIYFYVIYEVICLTSYFWSFGSNFPEM